MLLVVIDVRSLFKFVPANCSTNLQAIQQRSDFPPDLDIMASSSFPAGAAVKFWVPNLGARAPVDLTTRLPDYSEYVRSGLWVQRRRLRVCDGTGLTAYMPEGNRSWPDMIPVSNMKIRQTYCHMEGVTQEQVLNPLNAFEILERPIQQSTS